MEFMLLLVRCCPLCLQAFSVVFHNAIDRAEKSDSVKERVANLIDSITYLVFLYTSRGLFEADKLIFTSQVTFQVGVVSERLLLSNSTCLSLLLSPSLSLPLPPPSPSDPDDAEGHRSRRVGLSSPLPCHAQRNQSCRLPLQHMLGWHQGTVKSRGLQEPG